MQKLIFSIFLSSTTLAMAAAAAPVGINLQSSHPVALQEGPQSSLRAAATEARSEIKREAGSVTDNWQTIGEGTYTDILFSDLYGLAPQTFTVEFEQNVDDPSVYRIPHVYANMDFSAYSGLTYTADNTSPMIIHVYKDQYAYFEEFDTGVYSTYKVGINDYSGEIRMLMQGNDLLVYNDIATLATYLPESLCLFQNGNLTMEPTFTLEGRTLSNILGLCYVTGTPYDQLFRANTKGDFFISLPDAQEYDPNADWRDIGMATFTDVFTEGLYPGNPEYGTWEVEMQQNKYEGSLYRLVNPYKGWKSPTDAVTYDNSRDYYMTLMIHQYDGFSLVGIPTFYTGIEVAGEGAYAISNQAADALKDSDFLTLYYNFMGCLGYTEDDGVISYPSHCLIEYEYYLNFYGYCGNFSYDNKFYSANSQGNFKIVMPGAAGSGVETVGEGADLPAEYFSPQGLRIDNPSRGQLLIEKRGDKTRKIIFQ